MAHISDKAKLFLGGSEEPARLTNVKVQDPERLDRMREHFVQGNIKGYGPAVVFDLSTADNRKARRRQRAQAKGKPR